jgi:hypothetical protein
MIDNYETNYKPAAKPILFAPVIFILHVIEEAPGLVAWFNAHVDRGITPELFMSVNIAGGVITLLVVGIVSGLPSPPSLTIGVAWLSLLMFANGIFHIVATIVHREYCPGVVTSVVLYLPYFSLVVTKILRARLINWPTVLLAIIIGALPMMVHGYRIVFLRSRLF